MTISENLETFNGKPIRDFSAKKGIETPETVVYRLRLDYDSFRGKSSIAELIDSFCKDPKASVVEELIIGAYDFENSVLPEFGETIQNRRNCF